MSTAWQGSEVLWREPRGSAAIRVARRGAIAALALALSGLPGTPLMGLIEESWLRGPLASVGLLGLLLFALGLANLDRNKRVVLAIMGTGSIERPRSIQEEWLRRPQESVMGSRITVKAEPKVSVLSRVAPYVTLEAEGSVRRVPLFGTKPRDFIAQVNAIARSRGVEFVSSSTD